MIEFRSEDEVSVRCKVVSADKRTVQVIVGEEVVVVPLDDVSLLIRSFHEGDRVQVAGLPAKYDVNTGSIISRLEDGVFLVRIDNMYGAEGYTVQPRSKLIHEMPQVDDAFIAQSYAASREISQPGSAPTNVVPSAPEAHDVVIENKAVDTEHAPSPLPEKQATRPVASLTDVVSTLNRKPHAQTALEHDDVLVLKAESEENEGVVDNSAFSLAPEVGLQTAPLADAIDTAEMASVLDNALSAGEHTFEVDASLNP